MSLTKGRSFRALWDFLMSRDRQDELSALLDLVLRLAPVARLAPTVWRVFIAENEFSFLSFPPTASWAVWAATHSRWGRQLMSLEAKASSATVDDISSARMFCAKSPLGPWTKS